MLLRSLYKASYELRSVSSLSIAVSIVAAGPTDAAGKFVDQSRNCGVIFNQHGCKCGDIFTSLWRASLDDDIVIVVGLILSA